MLEEWVGKVVTFYVKHEESYWEWKLVKVDARGIYAVDPDDESVTIFVPYASLRHVSCAKS